jgi:hypothetical protein
MSGPQRMRDFRAVHDFRARARCTARPLQIHSVYMIENLEG